jgi:hypothetical protein
MERPLVHPAHIRLFMLCAVLGASWLLPSGPTARGSGIKTSVSFIRDVAPILKDNCLACHDSKKRKGKLDMTTYEGLRKGGTKEDPITAGKPDESLILDVLNAMDKSRMPPREAGDPLPKEKINLIAGWIAEGAKLDAEVAPNADLLRELRLRWKPPAPPVAYPYPVMITALAFTPDNRRLIVGGQHELTEWNFTQAELKRRVFIRAERTYALGFFPDGKLAAAGGRPGQEGSLCIYDLSAGKPRKQAGVSVVDGVRTPGVLVSQLLDTDDVLLCLAISADGKKIAAGGCDRLVNVWDLSGGYARAKLMQTIENHADWVLGLAFSPSGKQLLTSSRDKTAKVWDLSSRESVLTFPEHQSPVYSVAIKPDGKLGVSVGEDNQIRMWALAGEGKQVLALGGHGKAVFRVLYHSKKPLLATCSADGTVRLWDADNGRPIRTLSGHTDWVYALALSPDGEVLASGSWNGEVRVWKISDGSLVKSFNASPGYRKTMATKGK